MPYTGASDSKEDDPDIEFHVKKLASFCRICGTPKAKPDDRQQFPASKYSKDIKEIWKIDVIEEQKLDKIFPKFICKACDLKIKR